MNNETGAPENLREEFCDLLLPVMLHAVPAEEEGLFPFVDAAKGLSGRMVRRHPPVCISRNVTILSATHKIQASRLLGTLSGLSGHM